MKIAILGGGAAGLVSAWLLQEQHDVTVFEAGPVLGGHARTVHVEHQGHITPVETGFRYFFPSSYPRLMGLMHLLGLEVFSAHNQISLYRPETHRHLVLPPRSLAQWAEVLSSPRDVLDLRLLQRFMADGEALIAEKDWRCSLREFLVERGYPDGFGERLLFPLVAASWGAPLQIMPDFPAYSVLKVMRLTGSKAVHLGFDDGICTYVRALLAGLDRTTLRPSTPVQGVGRDGDAWVVRTERGRERFDQVVLATPAWVAADLLDATDPALVPWREALARFEFFRADICIHSDTRWMPAKRSHWAHLNHTHQPHRAWMTEWAGRETGAEVFRTWLPEGEAAPEQLHERVHFRHLVLTPENLRYQRELAQLQGQFGLHAAGMYVVDVDNHESSVHSAWEVGERLAPDSLRLQQWREATGARRTPQEVPRGVASASVLRGAA